MALQRRAPVLTHTVAFRMTEELHADFMEMVKESGLSKSMILESLLLTAFKKNWKPKLDKKWMKK